MRKQPESVTMTPPVSGSLSGVIKLLGTLTKERSREFLFSPLTPIFPLQES